MTVTAFWDDDAQAWVADSEVIPGLVTKALTIERLGAKLQVMAPELLELNAGAYGAGERADILFRLKAERLARASIAAA